MESNHDTIAMLDLISRPAFCVKDGLVIRTNKAAEALQIRCGDPIFPMLNISREDYSSFAEGCLYLTLQVSGTSHCACVNPMEEYQVFVLDDAADQAELKAMALAAQNLREPLSNILTLSDRLFPVLNRAEDPAVGEQLARINRGLFQMMRIVGNMADASRYYNIAPPPRQTRDVAALMAEQFEHIAAVAGHSNVQVHFENLAEPAYCLVDSEKLERAVYNMLSNAMKHTPAGSRIDARLVRKNNRLYLSVQNPGNGPTGSSRLDFHARFLRQPGLEDSDQGIGLGMVLIRAAAAAHSGTVLIEWPKDQGMRITMMIPMHQSTSGAFRSPSLQVDYAGEWAHSLVELSESLPAALYRPDASI